MAHTGASICLQADVLPSAVALLWDTSGMLVTQFSARHGFARTGRLRPAANGHRTGLLRGLFPIAAGLRLVYRQSVPQCSDCSGCMGNRLPTHAAYRLALSMFPERSTSGLATVSNRTCGRGPWLTHTTFDGQTCTHSEDGWAAIERRLLDRFDAAVPPWSYCSATKKMCCPRRALQSGAFGGLGPKSIPTTCRVSFNPF